MAKAEEKEVVDSTATVEGSAPKVEGKGEKKKNKKRNKQRPPYVFDQKIPHKKIYCSPVDELGLLLVTELDHKGYKDITMRESWLYAPGEIPILLVAHVDTVFDHKPLPKEDELWRMNDRTLLRFVKGRREGFGADDRAGVVAILDILATGRRPHVLFLDGEESGGRGAKAAVKEMEKIPDVRYIIELDRMNEQDAVFYQLEHPEFVKYIEAFGFKKAIGSFTDISVLCPEWKIAGVNLSIGYSNQHSVDEFLRLDWFQATVEKVCFMLDQIPEETFEYKTWIPYVQKGVTRYPAWNGYTEEEHRYSSSLPAFTLMAWSSRDDVIKALKPENVVEENRIDRVGRAYKDKIEKAGKDFMLLMLKNLLQADVEKDKHESGMDN